MMMNEDEFCGRRGSPRVKLYFNIYLIFKIFNFGQMNLKLCVKYFNKCG